MGKEKGRGRQRFPGLKFKPAHGIGIFSEHAETHDNNNNSQVFRIYSEQA